MISEYYLVIKSIHIIAVICWMVGLLYLPRLFVYHANTRVGSETDMTFRTMERRLFTYIMTPSMILSLLFGITLIYIIGLKSGIWLHIKLLFVLMLLAFHHIMGGFAKAFALGANKKTTRFFKLVNEIPSLLMIFIVFLAVLKPF